MDGRQEEDGKYDHALMERRMRLRNLTTTPYMKEQKCYHLWRKRRNMKENSSLWSIGEGVQSQNARKGVPLLKCLTLSFSLKKTAVIYY